MINAERILEVFQILMLGVGGTVLYRQKRRLRKELVAEMRSMRLEMHTSSHARPSAIPSEGNDMRSEA